MIHGSVQRAIPAPYALPVGFAMFLAVGTVAAGLHGRLPATGVLIACAVVAGVMSFVAEPVASVLLAGIGWLTAVGFSRPPYAQLRPTGPAAAHAAIVIGASALAGAGLGLVFRWYARRLTLVSMGTYTGMRARRPALKAAKGGGQPVPDGNARRPDGETGRRDRRDRRPPARRGRGPRRRRASAAHRGARGLAAAPEPGRRPAHLPRRGGHDHGPRRLLARGARRRGGQPPAQLVLHRAAAHVHHRRAQEPAGAAALRDRRGRRQQRGPPVRPACRSGRTGQGRGGRPARAGADRAGRRRLARGHPRSPHQDPWRPGRTAGTGGRPVGPGRLKRRRGPPARSLAHRHPQRPDPAGQRAGRIGHARPAGRLRRPGGGRARPGTAPHPGRPGRGAGRGQPDADRAARGGQPRPAHAARLDQGQRQQPAADGRGVVRGRPGRPAGDDRAERGPARRPHRQPARHEPPAHGIAAAVPAPDGDRRGGAGRPARAGRLPAARDGGARRLPAGARRSRPARADPGQPLLQRAAVLAARAAARAARRAGRRHGAARGGGPRPGRARRAEGARLRAVQYLPERARRASRRAAAHRVGDRHPGVGLGLAVAKGFAEAMGGRIMAKDTPGGGLTVQIALPAASGEKSALGAGS